MFFGGAVDVDGAFEGVAVAIFGAFEPKDARDDRVAAWRVGLEDFAGAAAAFKDAAEG